MKATLALIRLNLRLALRERSVLFFNYVFPLIFFFAFGQFFGARTGGSPMTRVIATVIVIGTLGSGLFGAGMRAVIERETGILRRYKVTPITPFPLLISSIVTGWLLYIPSVGLMIVLAHWIYNTPWPARPVSLFLLVSLGAMAFRSLGLIIASVANSMAESNILIQILYMPMLFLSGATLPISSMPLTAQMIAQFLPASYLNSAVHHVLIRSQGLATNPEAIGALIVTIALGLFLSSRLFRWEKDEKLPRQAKAWVLVVLLPFLMLGIWQAWSRDHIHESTRLDRELRRNTIRLIRGANIYSGDGAMIRNGAVLLKDGRIAEVFPDRGPDPESVNADPLEAAGKTVIPGLIDTHVHLSSSGGWGGEREDLDLRRTMDRRLAAYLYSGVTAVRSAGDPTSLALETRRSIGNASAIGAELFLAGPLFTAPGGRGTETFRSAPAQIKQAAEQEFVRLPQSAEQARQQVSALKAEGVDGIKAVLDAGVPGLLFQRMDLSVLRGIAGQARANGLRLSVHTGDARDVADAVAAGASSIEHGSFRDAISDATFAEMARRGVLYSPTLGAVEAILQLRERKSDLLDRSLLQQAAPPELIASTRKAVQENAPPAWVTALPVSWDIAASNLVRAWKAGVTLAAGSDAGSPLVLHGPAIQHEVELWVKAGIPAEVALRAATANAARVLGASERIGRIQKGLEATLVIVDGDPTQDIRALEHISAVFFQGERIDRADLFDEK